MRKVIKIPFDLNVPGELEIYTHLAGLRNRGRIDMLCAALGLYPDPVAHTSTSMPTPTPTPTPAPVVTPAPVATPAPVVAPETKSINDNDTPITNPNPNIDLGLSQMY